MPTTSSTGVGRRLVLSALIAVTAVGAVAVPASAQQPPDPAPAPPDSGLSAAAASQVEAIAADKAGRTRTERKVSSDLLYAVAEERDGVAVEGAPRLRSAAEVDGDGRTEVDIAGTVEPALLDRIEDVGGEVVAAVPGFDAVRALVPVDEVTGLAALPSVDSIAAAGGFELNRDVAPTAGATTSSVGLGSNEADVTMGAAQVRDTYGLDGTGVKVCVLSDGVDSLAARQGSGDLPAVDVLAGQAGDGDEGTAMLELVHDIAPGAELGFATALPSQAQFAQNILGLRASGCDVIVDDITYFAEAVFQDGIVAQAVSTVRAAGALFFTSASNSGNLADGTSGTWQGDFQDVGPASGLLATAGSVHGWGTGVGHNTVLARASVAMLKWADPLGGATNDYDLYVVNAAGTAIVDASTNTQDGNDDPVEIVGEVFEGERLIVTKYSGESRFLAVHTSRGRLAFATAGATFGHNASVDAISTAATPAAGAFTAGAPTGPFPGTHSAGDLSETFTSDGPVRQFFAPDGTPLTPGVFTSLGGVVHQGVDLTAADGTTTTTPGFIPFFGTSAAAPNAAAVAALALGGDPTLTPDAIEAALAASAIDIEVPGPDVTTGAGIVTAPPLIALLGLDQAPNVRPTGRTVTEVAGDGDAAYEPGEVFDVAQAVENSGGIPATEVVVALTSASADATVRSLTAGPTTLAAGATGEATFRVRISPDCECGTTLTLAATTTWSGGGVGSRTDTFTWDVFGSLAAAATTAYTGPAISIPDGPAPGDPTAPTPVTATIEVDDPGTVGDLTLTIGGSACDATVGSTTVGLAHSYVGDLRATLTSPAGTTVTLMAPRDNSGNNLCQTTFSDDATDPFASAPPSSAPYTGTFLPAEPLSAFDGEAAAGTWTLTMSDAEQQDTGILRDVSLSIAEALCDDLPNAAPTAVAETYATAFETPLTVPAPGVLGNDTDPTEDPITASLVDDVDDGTLALAPDGSFTYTPDAGSTGADTFTYTAGDGERSSPATTVTITVGPDPNTAPTAVADDHDTAYETPLTVAAPGVLGNDTDAEDDTLTATLVEDVEDGVLSLSPDGSFVYTPDDGFSGDDTFTYVASDGRLASATTTVTITVGEKPNGAPVAVADAYSTAYETLYTAAAPGVLGNDTDEDGDALTAALGDDVDHGTLALQADGSFTYTPDAGFSGDDTFTYTASDGELSSPAATVTITVGPEPNAAPAAQPDEYDVDFETTLTDAAPGVLGNDTDADGDALTAALGDDVDHGTLALQADGSFTYTPDAGFTGEDTFTYRASDGDLPSGAATVTLTVTRSTDAFVDALYRDFLGRPAEASGLAFWGDRLLDGLDSRATVARKVARSGEYARLVVGRAYLTYLGRPAEPGGLAYWSERVRTGLSVSELPIRLMGSPEFLARAGGTQVGFVEAVFLAVLGRAPTATERWLQVASLQRGTSRTALARAVHGGLESRHRRTVVQYDLLLDRTPTASERDLWAGRLTRLDDRDLAVALAATDEYLAAAGAP
ncbi:tandem-95 repeat protein [Iamia sp. SCSIO 61187]|uniref:Ig-like domain-containing protein n=1 Tax=Iamia sp. SCSIO 61187 TaxID=2722752 RepID=UPI001C6356F7|nr:Ig-like domain-containing protein [Iamia sp. SCSIO 61187]QYG93327.1 tandem-95 repeat protein [Iamia sp. SCSIO 61187]